MPRTSLDLEAARKRALSGNYLSRYSLTALHETGNRRLRFGLWNRPVIDTRNPTTHHLVVAGDIGRLDRISFAYYQDSRYWWAIATVNGIRNPLADMEAGQTLLIPRFDAIQTAIRNASINEFA